MAKQSTLDRKDLTHALGLASGDGDDSSKPLLNLLLEKKKNESEPVLASGDNNQDSIRFAFDLDFFLNFQFFSAKFFYRPFEKI